MKETKQSERVTVVIKPAANGDMSPWEGGINGVFFRVPRCVAVDVPVELYRLIEESAGTERKIAEDFSEYTAMTGKKLFD